jgi:hypothetical protein
VEPRHRIDDDEAPEGNAPGTSIPSRTSDSTQYAIADIQTGNGELTLYEAACRAVAECCSVDEVKLIKDKAEAIRAYARQVKNPQLEADAWAIRKRAEDKLGELCADLDKAPGRRKPLPAGGNRLKAQALKAVGISTSAANRYEQFNRLPAHEKERRIAQGRAAIEAGKSVGDAIIRQGDKKQRRDARERELGAKQSALPARKYGVIVADPEWDDDVWSRETGMNKHPANHYPTSDVETIKARPVLSIAADDAVLFLWSTNQHLRVAMDVMEAWGFQYRSNYVWKKPSPGTGFWNRSVHENPTHRYARQHPMPCSGHATGFGNRGT